MGSGFVMMNVLNNLFGKIKIQRQFQANNSKKK